MKRFYQLLGNNFIASIVNSTVWFALVFFLYLQTQSVIVTSVMSGIYLVIVSLTGIWFGSLVDHNDKKNIMIVSSVFSLIVYIISFFFYSIVDPAVFRDTSNPLIWIFMVIVLVGVIVGNIRYIALTTLVPTIVDEDKLDRANGLVGTLGGISFLIVSVISGFLVGHSGMQVVFILAIVLTLVTIIHLLLLPLDKKKVVSPVAEESTEEKPGKIDLKGTIKVIRSIPGLFSLILFTTFNNFLGGVFMSLMDAYGLSLVSVEAWGVIWGFLSLAFIIGGIMIAKFGLGKNPLRTLFQANMVIWTVCCLFTIQPSIVFLVIGTFIYLVFAPFIEAAEHTIIQKVVPQERLGRVFGFSQSIEQAASPLTAFAIGPITQLFFIPFMTTGEGARLIGSWFGTGSSRGIALVFTVAGIIGLTVTILTMRTRFYKSLSKRYTVKEATAAEPKV